MLKDDCKMPRSLGKYWLIFYNYVGLIWAMSIGYRAEWPMTHCLPMHTTHAKHQLVRYVVENMVWKYDLSISVEIENHAMCIIFMFMFEWYSSNTMSSTLGTNDIVWLSKKNLISNVHSCVLDPTTFYSCALNIFGQCNSLAAWAAFFMFWTNRKISNSHIFSLSAA